MIHVQLASQVTANGVDGIRWVLIEPTESGQASAPATAPALSLAGATDPVASTPEQPAMPGSLRLNLLKGLVILLGLGAALGLSRMQFGAPVVRRATPEPTRQPTPQPASVEPARPALAPAQPGSAASLVVKATTP
jgi:hypothetical protein